MPRGIEPEDGSDLFDDPPFPLTAIDRELLAMRDEDFHRITWSDLEQIIARNSLEDLKRLPSDLRRYLRWSYETKLAFGSITSFVVKERLRWRASHSITTDQPLSATSFTHHSSTPFADRRDFSVLQNDWPYGFANGITHLVVWSRTPIAVDPGVGDVTTRSRECITKWVQQYFVETLADNGCEPSARILWFKNWVSLQSVRGVDHIHILVRDLSEQQLRDWTSDNPTDY